MVTNSPSAQPDYGCSVARIAAVAVLFAALTVQVARSGRLTAADAPVTRWLVAHRTPTLTTAATALTDLGGPAGVTILVLACAGGMWWRRRRIFAPVLLVGTVAGAAVANTAIKVLVARDRPPALTRLVAETSFAYPSGHVAGTTALAGALLVACRARTRPWHWLAAVTAVVVIAATRLYLGVHWLTDTVAGMLVGTLVVLGSRLVADVVDTRRTAPAGAARHARNPAAR